MVGVLVFCIGSAFFAYVSRGSLANRQSHGFYRFIAWEFILIIFLLNALHWYQDPFSGLQLVSWFLLAVSIYFLAYGLYLLKVVGRPTQARQGNELYAFEKTSLLVTVGIYKYIRHPLYSSLLFLTWGIFFKSPSWIGLFLCAAASVFLYLTGRYDEAECLEYFGDDYRRYMQGTKRFIPYFL